MRPEVIAHQVESHGRGDGDGPPVRSRDYRRIREARPGDTVLGEEGGQTAGAPIPDRTGAGDRGTPAAPGRVRWVVDPLDGTVNYLYGLPDWAVSIAAEVDGIVVAGVVEVPRYR